VPYYATLLEQLNQRLGPYMRTDRVTARQALDGLAADWRETIARQGCR
jgi:multiple sugar transport system substrate-binding protein